MDSIEDQWEYPRFSIWILQPERSLTFLENVFQKYCIHEIASWKKRPIEELVIALVFDQIFYFRSHWTQVPGQSSICIVRVPRHGILVIRNINMLQEAKQIWIWLGKKARAQPKMNFVDFNVTSAQVAHDESVKKLYRIVYTWLEYLQYIW